MLNHDPFGSALPGKIEPKFVQIEGQDQTFSTEEEAKKWIQHHLHLREKAAAPHPEISNEEDESQSSRISP